VLRDSATDSLPGAQAGFQHDAFVYRTDEEFVRRAAAFVQEGLAAGESIVAALPPGRIALLGEALGTARDQVRFVDMTVAGGNPARLIPLWRDAVERHSGCGLRGLGEPAFAGRTDAEYDEAVLHEELLDLAFATAPAFKLYCPYQSSVGIDPTVTHSGSQALAEKTFRTALTDVPESAGRREVRAADLGDVREWVGAQAAAHGVSPDRTDDLTLALHEVCTNSIRFGGGSGVLSVWIANGSLICDVADRGRIDDLLVGRVMPPLDAIGGRGVWLANQLCDLVQLRSGDDFTQVRLYTWLR
jgi:anti-sigma regulatory factor (Ser/Thr protein kinase)